MPSIYILNLYFFLNRKFGFEPNHNPKCTFCPVLFMYEKNQDIEMYLCLALKNFYVQ